MICRAEIERFIPQRQPFLFVDSVVSLEPGRSVCGLFRVRESQPFFRGHFPGEPLMPGVLILEHMAQLANFLVAYSRAGAAAGRRGVLGGVDRARFLAPVRPGAQLVTQIVAVKLFEKAGIVQANTVVDDTPVARARLAFAALEHEVDER